MLLLLLLLRMPNIYFFLFLSGFVHSKREEFMSTRVKNLDKITKELLGHIQTWEEANGPFIYAVSIDSHSVSFFCLSLKRKILATNGLFF
jgi:hypothetical protein